MDSDKAISYQYKLWNFIGLNPADKRKSYILSFAVHFIFTGLQTLACWTRLAESESIIEICFVMFHAVMVTFCLLKFINLKIFSYKLETMKSFMRALDDSFKTVEEHKIFHESLKLSRNIFFIFLVGVVIAIVFIEIFIIFQFGRLLM